MGAWVSSFINSITGQISNGNKPVKYPPGSIHDGILSYSLCSGVDFLRRVPLKAQPTFLRNRINSGIFEV
jgi:hypothetical protein